MAKLVVTEYVTLDGVMEDPGGGEGSAHGGWSFQFWSEEAAKFKFDELVASDALLLGRVTYEGFARAWPSVKDEQGFGDRMNGLPKYVVSETLNDATWNNTRVISGDIPQQVARLKQQYAGDILVAGSATLVHTLMRHDLVDEYRILVHPVVLGGGRRLFQEGSGVKTLKLMEAKAFASGIVALSYEPARGEAED